MAIVDYPSAWNDGVAVARAAHGQEVGRLPEEVLRFDVLPGAGQHEGTWVSTVARLELARREALER